MAHGAGFYDVVSRDAAFAVCFDEAMGSDSGEYGEVLAGVASLVDVERSEATTGRRRGPLPGPSRT
jgi:hypothetical protein